MRWPARGARLAPLLGLAAALGAQDAAARLRTFDGFEFHAVVEGLDGEGRLRLGAAGATGAEVAERVTAMLRDGVPLEAVESVVFDAREPAALVDSPFVLLRSAQRLLGVLSGGEGKDLLVNVHGARGATRVPLAFVAAVRVAAKPLAEDGGFAQDLLKPDAAADWLYALQGERVRRLSVTVKEVRAREILVDFTGTERTLPLERVYGMVFAQRSGAPPPSQALPLVRLGLRRHEPVVGRLAAMDQQDLTLVLAEGGELRFPREQVMRMRVRSPRCVFLSDLEPARVEQTPALERVWPWVRDQAPGGQPIRLGGVAYEHGLVLIPRTRLSFAVPPGFARFETTVGLEDRAGPKGHAVFRILGDDKVLFDSGPFPYGTPPKPVSLDVRSVKTLTLEADFGDHLDLGDHCVFADARMRL